MKRRNGKPIRRRGRQTASQAVRHIPVHRPDRAESVTEMLNAVYGEDESASALDPILERVQLLSLRTDEEW
ncbi:MAG: hypothetical protein F4027_17205 [Rhodospirillaceae bacterium]|nr:hypothetical protein [Rhodospirillaceae bacterium]MYF87234.1 hypothetical protein [Rhodospirillaceae bacterium]MYH38602.1 hypothetical protein [Rhodospirillaceae bacterium]MYK13050.1 hypothetical protein [Rhodospirillaceae bacterium]MYK60252.1 hypothetical protein [Rhodospirillaceae bacterium]